MPVEQRLEENNVKNENERKKEYLRGYRTNRRRVSRLDGEVTELRELAESVKAIDYSGMPHGSGNQKDLSDELARIELLEKRLGEEKRKCIESYTAIEKQIKTVQNEDENDVLFYRYVKGLRWWEIAELMGCTDRWVHKLHGKALQHLKIPE
jgi:DNA-directed RNA polymerase specialized sigma24 family protein